TSSNKVFNNTIFRNSAGIESQGSDNQVRNNIVYQSGSIANSGVNTILSNNFSSDPLFLDVSKLDLRLQPSSSAIDAGVAVSEVSTDIVGVKRPSSSAYDIGAYEYTSAASTTIAPPTNLRVTPQQ